TRQWKNHAIIMPLPLGPTFKRPTNCRISSLIKLIMHLITFCQLSNANAGSQIHEFVMVNRQTSLIFDLVWQNIIRRRLLHGRHIINIYG
ncbi:hypothetical protein L9F63_025246, partial [Diploptera punctata]